MNYQLQRLSLSFIAFFLAFNSAFAVETLVATITPKGTGGSENSISLNNYEVSDIDRNSPSIIGALTAATNVYRAAIAGNGWRVGKADARGNLSFSLTHEINNVKRIVVSASRYSPEKETLLNVNSIGHQIIPAGQADPSFFDVTFSYSKPVDVNSISIETSGLGCSAFVNSIKIYAEADTHTASFSVNGIINTNDNRAVAEGALITFPTDPADMGGKSFVGWTTSTINGETNDEPALANTKAELMGQQDVTYYAVYADKNVGSETWVRTTASEVTEGVYALITKDGHAFNGIISSGQGGVTNTVFSFDGDGVASSLPTGTCLITLTAVSGGYTMYNASNGYLYTESSGTKYNLYWNNTENSYWKNDNGEWVYNKNSYYLQTNGNTSFNSYKKSFGNALLFAKKTGGYTYSAYSTSITNAVAVTSAGYATHVTEYPLSFAGTRVTAYTVRADVNNNVVHLTPVTEVPGGKAVVVKAEGGSYDIPVLAEANDLNTDLTFSPNDVIYDANSAYDYYYLGLDNGEAVFKRLTSGSLAAGKCFVMIDKSSGQSARFTLDISDVEDSITGITVNTQPQPAYNITGQRVGDNAKGIVIMGGKKYLKK